MSTEIATAVAAARSWLSENPDQARGDDTGVRGTLGSGLRVELDDGQGSTVITDMPAVLGGGGDAFTPGTLLRAAVASCNATTIAMIAAERDLELTRLEVRVDSVSDDRGMLGDSDVPAGPLELRVHYTITGPTLDDAQVEDLLAAVETRSPLLSTLRRRLTVVTSVDRGAGHPVPPRGT